MADSYFSCFTKHPAACTKNNRQQQLIQEREDALKYAEKLENELKRSIEQFNMRYVTFQQQLDDLRLRVKELEQQNKAKDQLLHGNSKVIMEKTTEIIKLKDEIDELKETLSDKEGERKIKQNETNSFSFCIHTPRTDPSDFHYHAIPHSMGHVKSQSDSAAIGYIHKFKKKQPTKPLPSNPKINEMPFIHRKSSTQTSSLSEAAVNLSFPGSTSPIIQIPGTNTPAMASVKPLQLSPICEMKSRDDETKKKRINLIKISDDNRNIVKEWGQSIAGSDDQAAIDEKITNAATVRVNSIPNEFTFIEPHDTIHHEDVDQQTWDNSSEGSLGEYLNVRKHSDNISYCSDNTIMLNDINLDLQQENMKQNSVNNMEMVCGQHFSKKSNGSLSVNECDIIESPIKVFLNHSFKIVVNND